MKYLDNNGLSYLWQKIKELISGASGIPTNAIFSFKGTVDEVPEGFEVVEEADNPYREIYEALFPIGRGFIDFTNTDYSNWLGLKWERELVGMFPVGYNPNDTSFNSLGKTGGEKSHTLTTSEMPSHTHAISSRVWSDGTNAGSEFLIDNFWGDPSGSNHYVLQTKAVTASITNGKQVGAVKTGGSQPHNNLPPYQVVSYWKRVAPKTMINFSIYGIAYQAEEGMTFGDWVASSYNTDGWEIYTPSSGYITNDTIKSGVTLYTYSASDYYGSGYTNASHLIIADYAYSCYQEK